MSRSPRTTSNRLFAPHFLLLFSASMPLELVGLLLLTLGSFPLPFHANASFFFSLFLGDRKRLVSPSPFSGWRRPLRGVAWAAASFTAAAIVYLGVYGLSLLTFFVLVRPSWDASSGWAGR